MPWTVLMDNPAALESLSAAIKPEVDALVFSRQQAILAWMDALSS